MSSPRSFRCITPSSRAALAALRPGPTVIAVVALAAAGCGPARVVQLLAVDGSSVPNVDRGGGADAGRLIPLDAGPEMVQPPGNAAGEGDAAVPSGADGGVEREAPPVAGADAGTSAEGPSADLAPGADASAPDAGPLVPAGPGPFLAVTHGAAADLTDLTAAGPLDWAHFGLDGASRLNRKALGRPLLTMALVGDATTYSYNDRPVYFSWQDGSPTAAVPRTSDGVSVGDATNRGFEIRVPASSARPRVLQVFLGVWGARGKLTASLARAGRPPIVDSSLVSPRTGADRIYTVVFRAGPLPADGGADAQPAGSGGTSGALQDPLVDTLVVRWTLETIEREYGNVTLQAAALSELPP